MRRRGLLVVLVAAAVLAGVVIVSRDDTDRVTGRGIGSMPARLARAAGPVARTAAPYAGLGAWVDGFDFGVAYQGAGRTPPISPAIIDDLAAHKVRTLYLQAARPDRRSPRGIVDGVTVAEMLLRAHRAGIAVVAWYLPHFDDLVADLRNLERLRTFDVFGHRFDGVALDIEETHEVPDTAERNRRLIELATYFHASSGSDVLGAIVLPPVQTEVLNKTLWPDFPWHALAPLFEVWLPMSYFTFRDGDYGDGYAYNEESTRRLRNNLGRPDALVHGIGGIGDKTTAATLDGFGRSLVATGSIGGSIYDWNSMKPALRNAQTTLFTTGVARDLPAPS